MNVFLVDLESVETRYTGQWKTYVPQMLRDNGFEVRVITGPTNIPPATSPGAFLNFGGTNIYKAQQTGQIAELFCANLVEAGDYFLFTDAWHPGIINLKYMSELLNIPVKIGALWHAGSYDPADFLGRLIGDAPWVRHAEQSFYHAIDHNYFATDFHIELFSRTFSETEDAEWKNTQIDSAKIIRTGWPMDYMPGTLAPYANLQKRDLIVFPHRIAPEKQVDIFRMLAKAMPQYEFVVCQDKQLTKHEYHTLLGEAKIVFSASLQETLGIGCYEGALVGAIPMVPDYLSYQEMYFSVFKYPSRWIETGVELASLQSLAHTIIQHIDYYETRLPKLKKQAENLTQHFFTATDLVNNLKSFDK